MPPRTRSGQVIPRKSSKKVVKKRRRRTHFTTRPARKNNFILQKKSNLTQIRKSTKPVLKPKPKIKVETDSKPQIKIESYPEKPKDMKTILNYSLLLYSSREQRIPTLMSVVKDTTRKSVHMNSLDQIQADLETLLTHIVVRNRLIESQILAQDKEDSLGHQVQKTDQNMSHELEIPIVKSFPTLEKTGKWDSMPFDSNIPGPSSSPQANDDNNDQESLENNGSDPPFALTPIVDKYCKDITSKDIKLLENLVSECENIDEYLEVPPLGVNMKVENTQDLSDQQIFCGKREGKKLWGGDRGNKKEQITDYISGPITRSTIARLKDSPNSESQGQKNAQPNYSPKKEKNCKEKIQKIRNPSNSSKRKLNKKERPITILQTPANITSTEPTCTNLVQSPHITTTQSTSSDENPTDEIMGELLKCQDELRAVNNWNHQHLNMLLKSSKEQICQQQLKEKLRIVDEKIRNDFLMTLEAKRSRRPLTRPQKKKMWDNLNERSRIIKDLYPN